MFVEWVRKDAQNRAVSDLPSWTRLNSGRMTFVGTYVHGVALRGRPNDSTPTWPEVIADNEHRSRISQGPG